MGRKNKNKDNKINKFLYFGTTLATLVLKIIEIFKGKGK